MANRTGIKFRLKQLIKETVQNTVLPVCCGASCRGGKAVRPGDEAALAAAVRRAHTDPERLDEFLKKYMGSCDGHATERIMKWMAAER